MLLLLVVVLVVCRTHKQQFHKEGAPEKQKSKIITAPSGQKYRDRAAERRDGGTIVTEDGAVIDEASLLGKIVGVDEKTTK